MSDLARRRMGTNGTELSLLGLGGTPLGGLHRPITDDEAEATVERAFADGITCFDTAPFYGFGLGERRMGEAVRRLPRDRIVISTKVGRLLQPSQGGPSDRGPFAESLPFDAVFDYSYDGAMRSLEESLTRLGLGHIDIVFIHDVAPKWHGEALPRRFEEAMEGAYRALDELRRSGDIKAVGVGINDCQLCLDFASAGRFDCFMLAGRYTLLDQSAADALLPHCKAQGIGILLAGPFNSGILATGARPDATFFYAPAEAEIMERTRRIEELCRRHEVPLAAAALQFSASHPTIASVVVGCRSPHEVDANIELLQHPIPDDFWRELSASGLIAPGSMG